METMPSKKELRKIATQIMKANRVIRNAIFSLGDLYKIRDPSSLSEEEIIVLAALLKNFHSEEGFEEPYGFYESYFQDFQDLMRRLEEILGAR